MDFYQLALRMSEEIFQDRRHLNDLNFQADTTLLLSACNLSHRQVLGIGLPQKKKIKALNRTFKGFSLRQKQNNFKQNSGY